VFYSDEIVFLLLYFRLDIENSRTLLMMLQSKYELLTSGFCQQIMPHSSNFPHA